MSSGAESASAMEAYRHVRTAMPMLRAISAKEAERLADQAKQTLELIGESDRNLKDT